MAVATIISSIGVLLALIQIQISKGQFRDQLQVTKDQFKLSNQGYLSLDTTASLFSPALAPGTPMSAGSTYTSFSLKGMLENAGNTPIILQLDISKFYFNNVEVFNASASSIGKSTLVPNQKTNFGLGQVSFTPSNQALNIPQIQALNITCVFKFSYTDFNSDIVKTVYRTLEIVLEDSRITGVYKNIQDSF